MQLGRGRESDRDRDSERGRGSDRDSDRDRSKKRKGYPFEGQEESAAKRHREQQSGHHSQIARPSHHSQPQRSLPRQQRPAQHLDRDSKTTPTGFGEFFHHRIFQLDIEGMRDFIFTAQAAGLSAQEISQRFYKLGKRVEKEKNEQVHPQHSVFPGIAEKAREQETRTAEEKRTREAETAKAIRMMIGFLTDHIKVFANSKFNAQDLAMLFYGLAHLSEKYDFHGAFIEIAPIIIDLLAWFKDGSIKSYQSLSMMFDSFIKFTARTEIFSFTTHAKSAGEGDADMKDQKDSPRFLNPLLRLVDRCLDPKEMPRAQPRQLVSVLSSLQPILEHGIKLNIEEINHVLEQAFKKLNRRDPRDQIEAATLALALNSTGGLAKLGKINLKPKDFSPMIVQCLVDMRSFHGDKAPKGDLISRALFGFGALVETGFVQEKDSAEIEASMHYLICLLLQGRFDIKDTIMALHGFGKIVLKGWIKGEWSRLFKDVLLTMKTIPSARDISMLCATLGVAIERRLVSVQVLIDLMPTFVSLGERFDHYFNSRILRLFSTSLNNKDLLSANASSVLALIDRWLNPNIFLQKLETQELAFYLLAISEFTKNKLFLGERMAIIYHLFSALKQAPRQFTLHDIGHILQALGMFAKVDLLPPKSAVEELLSLLIQALTSIHKVNYNDLAVLNEIFRYFTLFVNNGYLANTQLIDSTAIVYLMQKYIGFTQHAIDPKFSNVMLGFAKLLKVGAIKISKGEHFYFDQAVALICSSKPVLLDVLHVTDAVGILAEAGVEPIKDKLKFTDNITLLLQGLSRLDKRSLLDEEFTISIVIRNIAKLAESEIFTKPNRDFGETVLYLARLLFSSAIESKTLSMLVLGISTLLEHDVFRSSFLPDLKNILFELIKKALSQNFNTIDATQILIAIQILCNCEVANSAAEIDTIKKFINIILKPEFCSHLDADNAISILRHLNNIPITLEIPRETYLQLLSRAMAPGRLEHMPVEDFLVIVKLATQRKELALIDISVLTSRFQDHLRNLSAMREWTSRNIITAANIVYTAKNILQLGILSQNIQESIDTFMSNLDELLSGNSVALINKNLKYLSRIFIELSDFIVFHDLKLSRLDIFNKLAQQILLNINKISGGETLSVLNRLGHLMTAKVLVVDSKLINKAVVHLAETLPENENQLLVAMTTVGRLAQKGLITSDLTREINKLLDISLNHFVAKDSSPANICSLFEAVAVLSIAKMLLLGKKFLRVKFQDLLNKLIKNQTLLETESLNKLLFGVEILARNGFLELDQVLLIDFFHKICNELYRTNVTASAANVALISDYFASLGECFGNVGKAFKLLTDMAPQFYTLLARFAAGRPNLKQIARLLNGIADYTNAINGRTLNARELTAKLEPLLPSVLEQATSDNESLSTFLTALAQLAKNGMLALPAETITAFINQVIAKIGNKSIFFILNCAILFEHKLLLWDPGQIKLQLQENLQAVQSESDHVLMLDTLHKFGVLDVPSAASLLKIFQGSTTKPMDVREDKEQDEKRETIANSPRYAFRLHKILGYCIKVKKMTLEQLGISAELLQQLDDTGNRMKETSSQIHTQTHARLERMLINPKTERPYPRFELVKEKYCWGSFIDTAVYYHNAPNRFLKIAIEIGVPLFHADFAGSQLVKDKEKEDLLSADEWICKSFLCEADPGSDFTKDPEKLAKDIYRFIVDTVQAKTTPRVAERGTTSFVTPLPKEEKGQQKDSKVDRPPVDAPKEQDGMQWDPVYMPV